jgi:predicted Zn-dependent protease
LKRSSVSGLTQPDEVWLLNYRGEESDFARLSRNRIRQAGHVAQHQCHLKLIQGRRQVEGSSMLTQAGDGEGIAELLRRLRDQLRLSADDPHLLYATEIQDSEEIRPIALPEPEAALAALIGAASGLDLVGLWASGPCYRGFANSLGQRNWYASGSFNLDVSMQREGGQPVKLSYAGQSWAEEAITERFHEARLHLDLLATPPKALPPGRYRAYLAPHALAELLGLLGWDGLGLKSHRTLQTPLLQMVREGRRLHPAITLLEDHGRGLTPRFTKAGFLKPERVVLIEQGVYRDCLVDERSAAEYGVAVNAEVEAPCSLCLDGGSVLASEVSARVDSGLYISHLWYCNYSDRMRCRMTATTRFGCLWVEGGRPLAPIPTLRFDESLYHLLGDGLIGLTDAQELIQDPGTYGWRSTSSMRLPGALVEDVSFTM